MRSDVIPLLVDAPKLTLEKPILEKVKCLKLITSVSTLKIRKKEQMNLQMIRRMEIMTIRGKSNDTENRKQ